jgi:hypothetical protein
MKWTVVDRVVLVSKATMVAAAVGAGYGDKRELARTFVSWQQLGLMGKMTARAERRGGEGLWHPTQRDLWLGLLSNRLVAGVRTQTLANFPVGGWLLGMEGIETEQAQKAFSYWASYLSAPTRPTGERSLRRRAIEERVDQMADPTASETSKRELRHLLEIINDLASYHSMSPDTFLRAALGVMVPQGTPSKAHRFIANMSHGSMKLQLIAGRHLALLDGTAAGVLDFWEWSRKLDAEGRGLYLQGQPAMAAHPEIGRFYRPFELEPWINQSCLMLLTVFGIGIGHLLDELGPWPKDAGVEPPPKLPGLRKEAR